MKTFTLIIALLCLLGCGQDSPTEPQLTEEDVARIVAEELAKMNHDDALTPQEIAEIALRSLALVRIETPQKFKSTGFVVGKDLIATTYHSIAGIKAGSVELIEPYRKHAINSIAAVDESHDLAILSVSGLDAPLLECGDSSKVNIGDTIYVAGNPLKYRNTFSLGIVSGFEPSSLLVQSQVLQITAPISPGNSGSPVLNKDGEVIAIISSSDVGGQNLNFAIPSNRLSTLLSALK